MCERENPSLQTFFDERLFSVRFKRKYHEDFEELNIITMKPIVFEKKDIHVVIEQVSAMPGQGVTSMFNFGQSFGVIKGICAAMQLPIFFVRPVKWKKHFELINTQKDASRTKAIEMFPKISSILSKKKDSNKADAILIASFYEYIIKNNK